MSSIYFKIIKNENILNVFRFKLEEDLWDIISEKYLNNNDIYIKNFHDNPYETIYFTDLKDYLKLENIEIYNHIKDYISKINENIEDNNIKICLSNILDYRDINENFNNEMNFLEIINSDISELNKKRNITEQILLDAGFEFLEKETNILKEFEKNNGIENYKVFRKWTDDKNPIKLDIDNGLTNSDRIWHLHIDNKFCESIGSADINTVWQFNMLMEVFGSNFRL